MEKTHLVFGAAGSIGRAVTEWLSAGGHRVIASVRHDQTETGETLRKKGVIVYFQDVDQCCEVEAFADWLKVQGFRLDGVVYSVGHCPPGGFSEAIKYPLSQLPLETYRCEIGMHQIGVLNVFQNMLENIKDGGCFVFISSAITRLKGRFPPFLHAHHHASVISAADWLVDGMRHDPTVSERRIKIHRIAPAAVDTPFHQTGPKPPELIPVSIVVDEIVRALDAPDHVDKQIV